MLADVSFGDLIWSIIVIFFMVVYFMILFQIIVDLFRDHEMGGFMKVVWILALLFVPLITILVYLIVRGPKMQQRALEDAKAQQKAMNEYIRDVSTTGGSPADQVAKAKELLDSGAISQEEFDAMKAKALA